MLVQTKEILIIMVKKTALLGMLTSLALIASYIETLIPVPIPVPGVKLGLANLIILIVLKLYGAKEGLLLNILRILLAGFLFGSFSTILYSLAGGLLSFAVMGVLLKTKLFSLIGVSIAGGVCHNLGQLLLAIVVLNSAALLSYMPVLLISGLLTGLLIGIGAEQILRHLPKNL